MLTTEDKQDIEEIVVDVFKEVMIPALDDMANRLDGRIGKVENRLDGVENRLEQMDRKLDVVTGKVFDHDSRISKLEKTSLAT